MLTVFNRRELITVLSGQQLNRVLGALHDAGIKNSVRLIRGVRTAGHGRRGRIGMDDDAMALYRIYVNKEDYTRAKAAIQPVLQGF